MVVSNSVPKDEEAEAASGTSWQETSAIPLTTPSFPATPFAFSLRGNLRTMPRRRSAMGGAADEEQGDIEGCDTQSHCRPVGSMPLQ